MIIKKYGRLSKCLCIALAFLLASPITIFAKSISEIEAEQEELADEKAVIEAKLEELRAEEAEAEEYQAVLLENISITKERVDIANESITSLNASILELEESLEQSALEYEDTLVALKSRIVAVYKAGDTSTLEILLNATSLYDFSLRTTALEVVAEYDQKLMEEISVYIEETKIDRETLSAEKEQVALLKVQLEEDQEELEVLVEENKLILAELALLSGEAEAEIEDIESYYSELDKEIEELLEEQAKLEEEAENAGTILPDNGTNSSFDAAWPVPGFGTNWITSYWGDDRGHKGIDIAAYYGTPIVAAESGTVVDVRYSSGWGNHVVIYHNGTYTTLYAHMSSYAVSEGDYVSKNQVIGYVGSTGNSTGNHLHFEIYVDGTRVDPYPYL